MRKGMHVLFATNSFWLVLISEITSRVFTPKNEIFSVQSVHEHLSQLGRSNVMSKAIMIPKLIVANSVLKVSKHHKVMQDMSNPHISIKLRQKTNIEYVKSAVKI